MGGSSSVQQYSQMVLQSQLACEVRRGLGDGSGQTYAGTLTEGEKVLTLHTHTDAYLNEGAEKQDTHTHPVQVAIYTTNLNN